MRRCREKVARVECARVPATPQSRMPKPSKQRTELCRNTLGSDEAAMPARFRRLSVFGWLIVALAAASIETHAQDLEPRAFANTPVGLNFLIGGYAYAKGTVGTDASVPLEDTEVRLNSAVLAYVRTLDLWGRSGKFDVILPYAWASGSAKLAGQPRKRDVSGLGDPRFRFSMLLYGGPALSLDEFRDFQPDVIIGTMLEVTAPLGQYDSDKLLNIGTNRWSFKPEIGVSKTLGPLTWSSPAESVSTLTITTFSMAKLCKSARSILCRAISFTRLLQGCGWGSMVSTIPAGARPSTEKKAKPARTPAWALP
jgi:outer membrane putative beta-barrel porin/alpha-amylase